MQRTFKDIVKEQIPPQIIMVIALVTIVVTGYCVWLTSNAGDIVVTVPVYGGEVYIDGTLISTSKETGEKITSNQPAGRHSVIVARTGFWPWTQTIDVEKNKPTELLPFLVSQKPAIEHMAAYVFDGVSTSYDQEYEAKMAVFDELNIAESVSPFLGALNIKDIKHADFFPGRNDVLVVAAGQKVFAIDIQVSNPRNYEPIFEGTDPNFFKASDNTLYIKDGASLYHVTGLVPSL